MRKEQANKIYKLLIELYCEEKNIKAKKIVLKEAPLDLKPRKN